MPVPPLGHVAAATPVAVVYGGPSAEHDVSIVSGTAIADALAASGYPVAQWLIDLDGGWWRLPADHRREGRPQAAYDEPRGRSARRGRAPAAEALARLAAAPVRPVVFLALHGPFGEDGTVQALCEAEGLAYTGSGVTASAIGMDKAIFKRLVRGLGLPVVDWIEVRASRWAAAPAEVLAELEAFAAGTGDPRLMVKPARLGSSLGMTLAHAAAERPGALDEAFRFDDLALVERYLAGARDLEVAVIGNEPDALELYGPGEILSGHEFYDYVAKYTPGMSETSQTAEVTHGPARRDPQAGAGRLPGDRLRGLRPGRLPPRRRRAGRVRDQHDPGVHADQPVPDAAGRRRLRLRRRVPPRGGPRAGA